VSFRPHDTVPVCLLPDGSWVVTEPLQYVGNPEHGADVIDIPVGFGTDFGSVPKVLRALLPTIGRAGRAFLVHDVGCVALAEFHLATRQYELGLRKHRPRPVLSSIDVDGILRRILGELGVWDSLRWLYWTGVRWGALANPARRAGWWRTAPQVIGISVLAAPVVIPVAIVTAAAGAVLTVVEGVSISWRELFRR
jgi:hypothetical protein